MFSDISMTKAFRVSFSALVMFYRSALWESYFL